VTNGEWVNVGGGDGFYTAQDPTNPDLMYAESQGGNVSRIDLATGARTSIIRGGGRNRRSSSRTRWSPRAPTPPRR
jgi:hypothetical protein